MQKVKKFFSILIAVLGCVYLLLRIFGILDRNFHFKFIKAHALDYFEEVTLTPQETIGLYGNRMQLKYTTIDQVDQYLQLELMGSWDTPSGWPTTSSDLRLWRDPNNPNGNHWGNLNILWWYPTDPYNNPGYQTAISENEYLIYGCWFPSGFFSSSSIAHPNIVVDIDFPEGITCLNYQNCILFTRSQSAVDAGWSLIRHYGSKVFPSNQMIIGNNTQGKGQSLVTPFPENIDNETGINMGCILNLVGDVNSIQGEPFTLSQEQWVFNGCDVVESTIPSEGWFIVYVQCPKIITNINLPLPQTTEPPAETTRSDFTTYQYTYDLSPLETNQINQINIQNQQLQVEMAQLDGINYICRKLDQIYNEMVQRGEVPVNLISADPLHTLDPSVQTQMLNVLDHYTTAQIPDAGNGYEFYHALFYSFTSGDLAFFGILGIFSLTMLVLTWFIFRGRGG